MLTPDLSPATVDHAVDRIEAPPDLSDAESLRRWLAARQVDVDAVRGLPSWNAARDAAAGRHRRLPPDFDRQVDTALDHAFRQAVTVPLGAAVLCCYVRQVCLDAWKTTYHFDRMWATLRGARRSWTTHRPNVADAVHIGVADAVARLLETLDWEIAVENEMIGNNLVRLADVADRAAACAAAAVAAASAAPVAGTVIARFVAAEGAASRCYNAALAGAGRALVAFFDGAACDGALVTGALAGLRAAEGSAGCDPDQRSELRAYRNTLERLCRHRDDEWLHIDDGTVIHMYPFAVRGMSGDRVVAAARADGGRWELAGVRPHTVNETLALDDIWNGSDALGRRYDGAAVALPDAIVEDLDGRPLGRLVAEVRLSQLGNHHLRLAMDLRDASVSDVYSAVLRSAPEHAEVRVRCAGTARVWPRLSAYAVDVIEAIGAAIGGGTAVSVRPGMFHVLITVLEASLGAGPRVPRARRRPVVSVAELRDAVGGQVLLRAVPNIFGAPADWISYPPREDAVLDVDRRCDEMVARTCNTTLIAALGSPAFWVTTRLQMAEFTASLDGLFAGWSDALALFLDTVTKQTPEPAADADVEALTRHAEQLERQRVRLHAFAADARATLDLIRSPALVASPLVARTLRAMLAASGFAEREAELTRNVDAVLDDRLGQRLEVLVRRRREREAQLVQARDRRQRARLDTMLAVIAAVGVSGLGQILQAGYDLRSRDAVAIIVVIVLIMVVVGAVTRYHRPSP
ncbi:hypothetical protein WEI85_38670 [Actinomycetes bacterium KLBMP 9797]